MMPSPAPISGSPPIEDRLDWKASAALFVMLGMFGLGVTVGFGGLRELPAQLRAFLTASIEVVPFVMLALLAYIGTRRDWGKVLAFLWLLFIISGLALYNILSVVSALLDGPLVASPGQPSPALVPGAGGQIGLVVGLSTLSVVVGCLGFIPGVRRWLSRFLPLDPRSFVHTLALVAISIATLVSFVPLLVLQAPPILQLITNQPQIGEQLAQDSGLANLIYRLVWALPGAFFAVGYAVRRNLAQSLQRLGFVLPSLRDLAFGVGVALLLSAIVWVGSNGINWLWQQLGWPTTDGEAFEQLIQFALNPLGAVVIGVVAGISEELAVRGVLQPRLGLVLSNVFFTSVHALQYNWDVLLVVFVLGLAFGVLRQRFNTTTSAVAHGVYNFTQVMIGLG